MTSILDKSKIIVEEIKLSRDETYHIYNDIPLYEKIFASVMSFQPPGIAAVRDETSAYHINLDGKPIYQKRFIKTFGFYGGIAAAVDESGWFHINTKGKPQYKKTYNWVGNFQEERCVVRDKEGNYFHIKTDGNSAYNEQYNYVGDFKYGIAVVYNKDGRAKQIDIYGKDVNKKLFEEKPDVKAGWSLEYSNSIFYS